MPITVDHLTRRPLAVMVENSPRARPQSGLRDACIVYEAITEGGITRFLAIYQHGDPTVVGPVRSARPHFINLTRDHDATYVHCGESYEALQILATDSGFLDLDEMKYAGPFWRDRSRRAPHNLYTSSSKLRKFMQRRGWEGEATQRPNYWTGGAMPAWAERAEEIHLRFPGAVGYKLRLRYDTSKGGYLRYMDGKLHVDRETHEPIIVRNLIVQRVQSQKYESSTHGTYDVQVVGTGAGQIFSQGRMMLMRWEKTTEHAPTVYHDAEGQALPMLSGQTWVEILPLEGEVKIVHEEKASK